MPTDDSSPKVDSTFAALEKSKVMDPKKTNINERELNLRDKIRQMSAGAAQDRSKMETAIIELLHFPSGVSPALGAKAPPSSPSSPLVKHEDVVKDLFEAEGKRILHPHNVSALVDGYFTLISLCLCQSAKNPQTPYLDLSPLYGCTDKETKSIRTTNGRGTLRQDSFLDERVQLLPPIVSALLVLWNRNHNLIAHDLFMRFSSSKGWKTDFEVGDSTGAAKGKQDEDIFNAARNINCMQFRNTVSEDILKGLFGLSPFDSSLSLHILVDIPSHSKGVEMTTIYKESRLLHTLCPMMSEKDASSIAERLRNGDIRELFGPRDNKVMQSPDQDPTSRDLQGLGRGVRTVQFQDEDLAEIFASATKELACAPTAKNSPSCSSMFHLEALQDEHNLKACTFNKFRELYGLKPLTSFLEWNSDQVIATAAENLYKHIDQLGLYVGLQCEAPSPSGFGFGFTKTYALIVDLVTRIRSDPASTTPNLLGNENAVLSAWIKHKIDIDQSRSWNGAVLPTILHRNLPKFYLRNNAYAYSLFHTPTSLSIHALPDITSVKHVFHKPELYHTLYANSLSAISNNYGYLLGFDGDLKHIHDRDRLMTMYALIPDKGSLQRYSSVLRKSVISTVKKHQSTDGVFHLANVVKEVVTLWVCDVLCDFNATSVEKDLSSQDATASKLGNTIEEIYAGFADLYTYIVHHYPEDGVETRATKFGHALRQHLEVNVKIPKPAWLVPKSYTSDAMQELQTFMQVLKWLVVDPNRTSERSGTGSSSTKSLSTTTSANSSRTGAPSAETPVSSGTDISSTKSSTAQSIKAEDSTEDSSINGPFPNKTFASQNFPQRAIEACWSIPYPEQNLDNQIRQIFGKNRLTQHEYDEVENNIKISRIVANVTCLAAMGAVKYSQACILVIDFYLQDKYAKEREEIVMLSQTVTTSEQQRLNINRRLSGYIHEALRISQPITLWRRAVKDDIIVSSDSESGIAVREGDIIFADFQKLHNTGDHADKVDPEGPRIESLLGLGIHKCPAFTKDPTYSFIDVTMAEVIKAIFSLKGLSRTGNYHDNALNSANAIPTMDPRGLISQTGKPAHYPETLKLKYLPDKRDQEQGTNLGSYIKDQLFKWARGIITRLVVVLLGAIIPVALNMFRTSAIRLIGSGINVSPSAGYIDPLAVCTFSKADPKQLTIFSSDVHPTVIQYCKIKQEDNGNSTLCDCYIRDFGSSHNFSNFENFFLGSTGN